MSKLIEEWKPVVGYEGLYDVSDWGNVRSLDRYVTQKTKWGYLIKKTYKGRILKKFLDKDGYQTVRLCKQDGGKSKRVNVLVAEAFIPNPENKPVVGHLKTLPNGLEDKTANEAWNLQWMTFEENSTYGTLSERKSDNMKKAYEEGRRKKVWEGKKRPEHSKKVSIPVIEIKEDGSTVEWENSKICAKQKKASYARIINAVNGKNRKRGHYYGDSQFYKKEEYEKMLGEFNS